MLPAPRAAEAALRIVRPDGQVTKVGWSPAGLPIDTNPIVQKNVRLQGSFSHNFPSGSASFICSPKASRCPGRSSNDVGPRRMA
jgi:threonine dehydrogenase-like Zn-dependent dehydrogenase